MTYFLLDSFCTSTLSGLIFSEKRMLVVKLENTRPQLMKNKKKSTIVYSIYAEVKDLKLTLSFL
jgi:hypothetical protein